MTNSIEQFKEQYPSTKLIPCFRVKDSVMNEIEKEVKQLTENCQKSLVNSKEHPTNWTKPYGTAVQLSLFNTSGDTSDFSTDHNNSQNNKFFVAPNAKNVNSIFKMFEHSVVNFRINGMGKNSGLSPHKESNIIDKRYKCRFHLPVFTNKNSWVMIGWEKFWLKRGIIYFFNNGLVHSAGNNGEEIRYHLVFDTILDDKLYNEFFNKENLELPYPNLLTRIPREEINELLYSEPVEVTTYEEQHTDLKNKLFSRFNLKKSVLSAITKQRNSQRPVNRP
jgi:hypothetical protein